MVSHLRPRLDRQLAEVDAVCSPVRVFCSQAIGTSGQCDGEKERHRNQAGASGDCF